MSEFDYIPHVFRLAKQQTGKDQLTYEEFKIWNNIYCNILTDEQATNNNCIVSCDSSGGMVVVHK